MCTQRENTVKDFLGLVSKEVARATIFKKAVGKDVLHAVLESLIFM